MAKHVARKTKRNTRQDFAQPKGLRVEQWSIERLVEYAGNPRENDNAVDRMCETIKEFGFRIPIVAKSDGLIVDGHLRYKAARKLGLESVPVALADGLTDVQIRAFRIAANQSANWATWSPELLRLEVSELKLAGFDMPLLGFDDIRLEKIIAGEQAPSEFPGYGEDIPTEHECPKCHYRWSGKFAALVPAGEAKNRNNDDKSKR